MSTKDDGSEVDENAIASCFDKFLASSSVAQQESTHGIVNMAESMASWSEVESSSDSSSTVAAKDISVQVEEEKSTQTFRQLTCENDELAGKVQALESENTLIKVRF